MGNCAKPQQAKKKVKEPVLVVKEHFRFRQLQILNRLNPTHIELLLKHFTNFKTGTGVRKQKLAALYPGLEMMPETYATNLFGMLDLTNDGVICFTDFCVGVARVSLAGDEEQVRFLFDFLNLRATSELAAEQLMAGARSGAVILKRGTEKKIANIPEMLSFDAFTEVAQQCFEVEKSLAFCTFLPPPKQQKSEVLEMMRHNTSPAPGEVWYVIASNWVHAWQRYVDYPISLTKGSPQLNPLDEDDIPTSIDNSNLCSPSEPLVIIAQADHFIEVSDKVWRYWVNLYGGGPSLPREAYTTRDGTVELDLYPSLLLCYSVTEALYDSMKVTKVLVSQFSREPSLKSALAKALKVTMSSFEAYLKSAKKWEKVTEETKLDLLKPRLKCLIVEGASPLRQFQTLKETKSPATASEMKTLRILSQWAAEEAAEPPTAVAVDVVAVNGGEGPWKGIPNLGNTCYLNTVLQCLCYTPLFGHYFLNRGFSLSLNTHSQRSLSPAISSLFSTMTGKVSGLPDASKVHELLGEQLDLFLGNEENDSYECFIMLLDRLNEELKRGNTKIILSSNLSSPSEKQLRVEIGNLWNELHGDFGSPVSDLFSGVTKTEVYCPRCRTRTVTLTPTFTLDLQMPPQSTIEVLIRVLPLLGPSVTVGVISPVSHTVELLLKHVKATLEAGLSDLVLISWAYSGVFTIYDAEAKLQEIVHDGSVALYAIEKDPRDRFTQGIDEAAPDPGETAPQPQPSKRIFVRIVHRFQITKNGFQVRDYFPEVAFIPEKMTYSGLLEAIGEKTKRFRNEALPAERCQYKVYFVDFATKFCGICDKKDCLGCGILPSDAFVDWTKLKEKFVIWVRWEEPDSFAVTKINHPSVDDILTRQEKGINIEDCLGVYSKAETLSAQCGTCRTDLMSNIEIVKLPDVLVVTLCRFKICENVPLKVNYLVQFPITSFNMGKWVSCSESEPNSCTALKTPLQYVYDLYSVIDHIGNAKSGDFHTGHYRAYCKQPDDKWVRFDDSQAREVQGDINEVLVTSSAYMLFYKKRIMQSKNLVQFFT